MLIVGLTEIEFVVALVFQEYVLAPVAVIVVVFPEHKVLELALIFTVGVVVTFIVIVFVLVQFPFVPVTV